MSATVEHAGAVPRDSRPVPQHRKRTENMGDPRGQFGSFLRNWLDRQSDRTEAKRRVAAAAGVSERAVGTWELGTNGPPLQSLDSIARAMGYADWAKLALAAVRFCESR
jgi:hypothetical protein